jgi:transposase
VPTLDVQTLLAENARLREELAATRAALEATREELGRLREETAAGHARIAELTAEVGRFTEQVARSNDRITELAAAANRNRRKPAPPPKPPPPPAPPPEGEAAKAFENRPRPPVLPDKPKPEPKPRRPTGRKPLPGHLPADESESRPEGPCECGCCDIDIVDEVVEVKLDVVREHQRRRVVRRKTGRCRRCGKRRTGPAPAAPFPRSKVTCGWLAWLVVQKFYLLVPLDRIRRHLALSGVPLSISFLVSQVARAADLLEAVDGEHWRLLLAGSWMQSDGTSLKVIVPDLKGAHNGHLEVYLRNELVVFQYEPEKGAETVAAKLRSFKGLLQVDAEHRYNLLFETGQCIEIGCNAHGVRKFEAADLLHTRIVA